MTFILQWQSQHNYNVSFTQLCVLHHLLLWSQNVMKLLPCLIEFCGKHQGAFTANRFGTFFPNSGVLAHLVCLDWCKVNTPPMWFIKWWSWSDSICTNSYSGVVCCKSKYSGSNKGEEPELHRINGFDSSTFLSTSDADQGRLGLYWGYRLLNIDFPQHLEQVLRCFLPHVVRRANRK